jgi:hypothetical protein
MAMIGLTEHVPVKDDFFLSLRQPLSQIMILVFSKENQSKNIHTEDE